MTPAAERAFRMGVSHDANSTGATRAAARIAAQIAAQPRLPAPQRLSRQCKRWASRARAKMEERKGRPVGVVRRDWREFVA